MIITASETYHTDEITDIDAVTELLSVKNPEYAQWKRFGSYYTDAPEEFIFGFRSNDRNNTISIPRNFSLFHPDLFKPNSTSNKCGGADIDINFTKSLRGYQVNFFKTVPRHVNDQLWEQPCGAGKTVCGTYWICEKKKRTLVLVPKSIHGSQWYNTLISFTDSKKILFPKSQNFIKDVREDFDVLIMSFDLFHSRDLLTPEFFSQFGMVILDEAHGVGAPTYQPVLVKVPSMYRLALTATFRRNDNMDKLLKYHFGHHVIMPSPFSDPVIYPFRTDYNVGDVIPAEKILGGKKNRDKYTSLLLGFFDGIGVEYRKLGNVYELLNLDTIFSDDSLFETAIKKYSAEDRIVIRKLIKHIISFNELSALSTCETLVVGNGSRNRKINTLIKKCIETGRKPLVIAKRKKYLVRQHEIFTNLGYRSCLFVGSTSSPETLKYANDEAQVVWVIYQIGKEGLDVPNVDTLFVVNAIRDLEQPAGRINRDLPGKKSPMVFYPVDEYKPFMGMFFGVGKVTRNVRILPIKSYEETLAFL